MKSLSLYVLLLLGAILFVMNLVMGSVHIPAADVFSIILGDESVKPSWRFIVLESRLPQAITAMFCGGALAVCGLLLQTAFRNPLAGPGIFGISSGAGLGVALIMLMLGGSLSIGSVSMTGFVAFVYSAADLAGFFVGCRNSFVPGFSVYLLQNPGERRERKRTEQRRKTSARRSPKPCTAGSGRSRSAAARP